MKIHKKMRFISLLRSLSLLAMKGVHAMSMETQLTLNLETTSEFEVLTGSTTISRSTGGDAGLYPGTLFWIIRTD